MDYRGLHNLDKTKATATKGPTLSVPMQSCQQGMHFIRGGSHGAPLEVRKYVFIYFRAASLALEMWIGLGPESSNKQPVMIITITLQMTASILDQF